MDLLQLSLHGQPADVGLQVGAVHHANAEHYERDVVGLRADQTPPPATCTERLVGRGWFLLLVLKDHFAQWLRGAISTLCRNEWQHTKYKSGVKLNIVFKPLFYNIIKSQLLK